MSDILAIDGAVNRLETRLSIGSRFLVPWVDTNPTYREGLRAYHPADDTSGSNRIILLDYTNKKRMATVGYSEILRCLYRALQHNYYCTKPTKCTPVII